MQSDSGKIESEKETVPWRDVFCLRPVEMALLQAVYLKLTQQPSAAPQIVTIVAESGLGKTRLIQEFYCWLSTQKDRIGGEGYWPDESNGKHKTLDIDPEPADCNPSISPPPSFGGVRFKDPGERDAAVSLSLLHVCAERFSRSQAYAAQIVARGGRKSLITSF